MRCSRLPRTLSALFLLTPAADVYIGDYRAGDFEAGFSSWTFGHVLAPDGVAMFYAGSSITPVLAQEPAPYVLAHCCSFVLRVAAGMPGSRSGGRAVGGVACGVVGLRWRVKDLSVWDSGGFV